MGRCIDDVHKRILEVIPHSETELIHALESYIQSIWNKAPEVRTTAEVFIPYYLLLLEYIPQLDMLGKDSPEWCIKCRDIFCDIS